MKRVEELQPELLWVLVPPNSLAKFAAAYKKKHPNVKLVLDFIDMWPETMPISRIKSLPPFSAWRNIRDKNVGIADAVVTECNLYWNILGKWCRKQKLYTLYLARNIRQIEQLYHVPTDRIALCYLGSINNIIDIPCIGEIIRKIDMPVDLHVIGDGEKREKLIQTAKDAGANVIFHGKVYDVMDKQEIFDQCHFGLNIMKESVYVGLTMKSIDYFEASLPIINNIKGDTWAFVERNQIGINYGPTTLLPAAELLDLQKRRPCVRAFFEAHFSEAVFAEKVDEILESLMNEE